MQYKPSLLFDEKTKSFKLVHIDPAKMKKLPVIYDSLNSIACTKNSPLKEIEVKAQEHTLYD